MDASSLLSWRKTESLSIWHMNQCNNVELLVRRALLHKVYLDGFRWSW